MTFMVRYCEGCRKAWPHTDGPTCPSCGQPGASRDSIAVINNLGKQLKGKP